MTLMARLVFGSMLLACKGEPTPPPPDEPPPPEHHVPHFVCAIGDSITYGVTGDGFGNVGGYRAFLQTAMPDLVFIGRLNSYGKHESYSGKKIAEIKALVEPALDALAPDTILLIAGANDVGTGEAPASIAARLATFASSLRAHPSVHHVIVGTGPDMLGPWRTASVAFNDAIAAALAPDVEFWDTGGALTRNDMGDPYHPNQTGYAKMAAKWKLAIERAGTL